VRAVIAAAQGERGQLLVRVLWASGGRVSEVLALRAADVRRDSLVGRLSWPWPLPTWRNGHERDK